jgi:hypothetical protein
MAIQPPEQTRDKPSKINTLTQFQAPKQTGPQQQVLNLVIERQEEVDGLEMGILSDGTPFLAGCGLASRRGPVFLWPEGFVLWPKTARAEHAFTE